MKEYTRDEVIEKLTNYSFDANDWEGIMMMLECGCKGYTNFTNQELIEEWDCFFEEDIKIKD